jgi:hypothetical protein
VPPGPEARYGVHFLSSGPGVTPLLSPLAPTLGVKTSIMSNALCIETLLAAVQNASLSYDVWITCRSKENHAKFVGSVKLNPVFMPTVSYANFVLFIVTLYAIYETRKDSHNIPQLIRRLSKDSNFPKVVLDKAKAMQADVHPVWQKLCILRNNAFGHFSATLSYDQAFLSAGLKPREVEHLISISKRLVNLLARQIIGSTHAFNLGAKSATTSALGRLARPK